MFSVIDLTTTSQDFNSGGGEGWSTAISALVPSVTLLAAFTFLAVALGCCKKKKMASASASTAKSSSPGVCGDDRGMKGHKDTKTLSGTLAKGSEACGDYDLSMHKEVSPLSPVLSEGLTSLSCELANVSDDEVPATSDSSAAKPSEMSTDTSGSGMTNEMPDIHKAAMLSGKTETHSDVALSSTFGVEEQNTRTLPGVTSVNGVSPVNAQKPADLASTRAGSTLETQSQALTLPQSMGPPVNSQELDELASTTSTSDDLVCPTPTPGASEPLRALPHDTKPRKKATSLNYVEVDFTNKKIGTPQSDVECVFSSEVSEVVYATVQIGEQERVPVVGITGAGPATQKGESGSESTMNATGVERAGTEVRRKNVSAQIGSAHGERVNAGTLTAESVGVGRVWFADGGRVDAGSERMGSVSVGRVWSADGERADAGSERVVSVGVGRVWSATHMVETVTVEDVVTDRNEQETKENLKYYDL